MEHDSACPSKSKEMIVRARLVVTMDGPSIENGAVAISGDKITDVGKFSEVSKRHSASEITDLGEQVLLPGLINAHCHLDYTCLRGRIPRPKSFTDWIRAINAEKAKLSPSDYVASINSGFAEARKFGTTTVANLTAFPELIPQIRETIRTWWFAELIDVRNPKKAGDIVDVAVQALQAAGHWGLGPHAPFTGSANLYRASEEVARRDNILLTTHLAESGEEMSMFHDASGPLYDFLKEIGREMSDCGQSTPLHRFSEIARDSSISRLSPALAREAVGMTDYWILVHLNELAERDLKTIEGWPGKFSIVHCPRSHDYFDHSVFQFEKLQKLGCNICLGTDSLASNDDLSLFGELRAFQKSFQSSAPSEILTMVTTNAARALNQQHALGKIAAGFRADLIAIPFSNSTSVFEEIVAFDQPVDWSMVDGAIQGGA